MAKPAYTIKEIASTMALSRQTVERLFEREPGTRVITRPEELYKRGYRRIRVAHAVYLRVVQRVSL